MHGKESFKVNRNCYKETSTQVFLGFPCVYKQMLRWVATFQVATTCISCSSPDLNLIVNNFMFSLHVKYPLPRGDNPIAVNKYYFIIIIISQVLSTKGLGLRDGTNLTDVILCG